MSTFSFCSLSCSGAPSGRRWRRVGGMLACIAGVVSGAVNAAAQPPPASEIADALRNRIEAGRVTGRITAAGEPVRAGGALPRFYRDREYAPAWLDDGRPSDASGELLDELRDAAAEGLRPGDYHLEVLDSLLEHPETTPEAERTRRVDLELLLTDAFLGYGSHLLRGRVNPESVTPEWIADRRDRDFSLLLTRALDEGIGSTLASLRPTDPGYELLRENLARLRSVAERGGWPRVGDGPVLRPGERDPRIPDLRRRLGASGDLDAGRSAAADSIAGDDEELYDEVLEEAVRSFQSRHGLEVDGRVGPATRTALNVPVEDRIRQLRINLERWRWLPGELGRRHIRVNIAGFAVQVWEEDEVVMRMRAVVGREYRQTPIFSGRMTYLVFAPFWHVPPGIAAADLFPLVRREPGYVASQDMELLDATTNRPVDPRTVEWDELENADAFNRRFRLRQRPGPNNALGDVKFMFPNRYSVYLHDTPSRDLFARTERGFSSGCIRVERPLELALYLLRADPSWTRERMERVIERRTETSVTLPEPVPVHLLYWTAWIDEEGTLQLRRDIYGRDGEVWAALRAEPPGP